MARSSKGWRTQEKIVRMWERLKRRLRKKPKAVPAGRGILGFLTTLELLRIQQKAYLRRIEAQDELRDRQMNRVQAFESGMIRLAPLKPKTDAERKEHQEEMVERQRNGQRTE